MPERTGIFISHITEEKPVALVLQAYLRKAFDGDIRVFVSSDSRSIGGGKKWFDHIIQSLRTSRVILVLVSQESRRREWINFEAGFGDGGESLVIPVSIKSFPLGQLSFPLAGYQGRGVDELGALLDDIGDAIGATPADIDRNAYEREIGDAEASLRYRSLKVEPVVQGTSLRFDIENVGNVDLELLMFEVSVPEMVLRLDNLLGTNMGTWTRNGVEYRRFSCYSERGVYGGICPVLRPILTPSMGAFRPEFEIAIGRVDEAARKLPMCYQVHAVGYVTEMG
jgi:hypothetical protein